MSQVSDPFMEAALAGASAPVDPFMEAAVATHPFDQGAWDAAHPVDAAMRTRRAPDAPMGPPEQFPPDNSQGIRAIEPDSWLMRNVSEPMANTAVGALGTAERHIHQLGQLDPVFGAGHRAALASDPQGAPLTTAVVAPDSTRTFLQGNDTAEGRTADLSRFAGGVVGGAPDPVNIAAMAVAGPAGRGAGAALGPTVEAMVAGVASKIGTPLAGVAGRLAMRAIEGAGGGAGYGAAAHVGQVAVEDPKRLISDPAGVISEAIQAAGQGAEVGAIGGGLVGVAGEAFKRGEPPAVAPEPGRPATTAPETPVAATTPSTTEAPPVEPVPATAAEVPPATPGTAGITVKAYRGGNPRGEIGGTFYSPDPEVARAYAGSGGQVTEATLKFDNPLVSKNWVEAKTILGLPASSTMPEVLGAAKGRGHDGVVFQSHNGKPEYVALDSPIARPDLTNPGTTPPEVTTSARKAQMAEDRKAMGLDELPEPERRGWDKDLEDAWAQGIPYRALSLAAEVEAKPRAFNSTETAGIVERTARLKNEYAAATKSLETLTDPTDIAMKSAEATRAEQEFDILSRALRASGTEKGLALAAQKLTLDQDYSLIAVKSRAAAAKGQPLTDSEAVKLRKLSSQIEGIEKQIADVQATGKAPDPKTPRPSPSADVQRLMDQRDIARAKLRQTISGLRPRTFWDNAAEVGNTSRNLVASTDYSAVMRQGGWVTMGHPVLSAKSLGPMFKAGWSPLAERATLRELRDRPNAQLYERHKLLTDSSGPLTNQEERFMSRIADKIPVVAGSQRAYTTFLNKLRADYFDALTETLSPNGTPSAADAELLAHYVKVATGRGDLGRFEDWGPALNATIFAPKLVASRFQLIGLEPIWHKRSGGASASARLLIAKEYGRSLSGVAAMYGLAALAGFSLDFDPRSATFGKIGLPGNRWLDPLFGVGQVTRFVAEQVMGQKKNSHGQVQSLTGNVPFGRATTTTEFGRFLRTKLAPIPGAYLDWRSGENVIGQPVTPTGAAVGMVTPLSMKNIYDAMRGNNVPEDMALNILQVFGVGAENHQSSRK